VTTPLRQLAAINANIETNARAEEFAALAKFIMASGGVSKAARAVETTSRDGNLVPRLARILKSGLLNDIYRGTLQKTAATPGTLAAFSDYGVIAGGFVNSLVNASAFDTMLAGGMAPVPLQTGTLGAVSTGAQAFSVAEGSTKAISKLSLTGQQQNPQKAHCIVVVTQELAKAPGANATQLIGRELRNAVAVTTTGEKPRCARTSASSVRRSALSSTRAVPLSFMWRALSLSLLLFSTAFGFAAMPQFLIEMLAVRLQVDEPQFWSIEKYTGRCVQCYQRRDGEDQAIVHVETGHACL
jgi:hypothetical protein